MAKRLLSQKLFNQTNTGIKFSIDSLENLVIYLGWKNIDYWLNYWEDIGGAKLAYGYWPKAIKVDWIWGLGLPLLSEIKRFIINGNQRNLIGISGLPGSGKTSLGRWIEAASAEMKWQVTVISLDDFYLPANELDKAMSGNPWKVPRALPGSHSIEVMENAIEKWLEEGELLVPQFDKSLRNGLGDRYGWRKTNPEILLIEGWFLGCYPEKQLLNEDKKQDPHSLALTEEEIDYRLKVQEVLGNYINVWNMFEKIWHIKPIDFSYTRKWKTEQEKNMQKEKGASLTGKKLDLFLRMIETSIPQDSLLKLNSDVIIELNARREIINLRQN